MSVFHYEIRHMSDEQLSAYLRETNDRAYARGTQMAREEMGSVLESLAKRCEAQNDRLAVLSMDEETSCFRPSEVNPTHTNIIYLDARTVRAFKHFISGR
jgi:hypothetical protein